MSYFFHPTAQAEHLESIIFIGGFRLAQNE